MSVVHRILLRMFGCPQGILGRLGGIIMARSNQQCAVWVIDLLDIQPHDSVLEVGFGPGVGLHLLAQSASASYVAGVDYSKAMVAQATARNAQAIERGRVDVRHGSVERLPFADQSFDKALAINSMQVWPDAGAGLRDATGPQDWRQHCARFHPLCGAAEERLAGNAHGCWLYYGARRRGRGGILCAGHQPMSQDTGRMPRAADV